MAAYDAWTAAGLPITTDVADADADDIPGRSRRRGDPRSTRKAMQAALAEPNIAKLDIRDVDEWIADTSSPYGKDFCPRKGRIPGARWIEWYRMMKPTAAGPRFKSTRRDPRRMRHRRRHAGDAGLSLLLQGRARLEHVLALKNAGVKDVRCTSARGTNGRAIRRCRSKAACR